MEDLQGLTEAVKLIDGIGDGIGFLLKGIIIAFLIKKYLFNGFFKWIQVNLEDSARFFKSLVQEYLANEKSRIETSVHLNNSLEEISLTLKEILGLIKEDRQLMSKHHKLTEDVFRQIKKRQEDFIQHEPAT